MTTLRNQLIKVPTRPPLRVASHEADGLSALEAVITRQMAGNPVARMSRDGDRILINPTKCGFAMSIMPLYGRIIVTCGGWDDDLDTWADVERIITAALDGDLRLVSVYANDKPLRFTIERRSGASWGVVGEKTFVRWSFFKPRTVVRYDQYQPSLQELNS